MRIATDTLPTAPRVDFLEPMGEASRRLVLEGSSRVTYPEGTVPYHAGDPPILGIVEQGLMRIFMGSADGRQVSLAYLHETELYGGIWATGRGTPQAEAQVVRDATLLRLDFDKVQRLLATEAEVAGALAKSLASRLAQSFRVIMVRSLGSIRERLAFDLLDRSCESQLRLGELVCHATHAELANAIGSSREVVSRNIEELRREGVVTTSPGVIRVDDPMRLAVIFRGLVS